MSDDYEYNPPAEENPYLPAAEIDQSELTDALRSLHFLGDDTYLRMQVYSLSLVDKFIMELEENNLRQRGRRDPADLAFLSAQSQMWIYAIYEVLRTWKERARDAIKLHEKGGLIQKAEALEKFVGFEHPGRIHRAKKLRELVEKPELIAKIEEDLLATHGAFSRLEHIRITLAKHEVSGGKAPAYAPGSAFINKWSGALDYELGSGAMILGSISRRNIADELRATADRTNLMTPEAKFQFDDFMKLARNPVSPFADAFATQMKPVDESL